MRSVTLPRILKQPPTVLRIRIFLSRHYRTLWLSYSASRKASSNLLVNEVFFRDESLLPTMNFANDPAVRSFAGGAICVAMKRNN